MATEDVRSWPVADPLHIAGGQEFGAGLASFPLLGYRLRECADDMLCSEIPSAAR